MDRFLNDLRQSWDLDPAWGANMINEVVRSVSDTGSLTSSNYFGFLATPGLLTEEEVIDLYRTIAAKSQRLVAEWQPEFEAAFPQWRDRIPPALPGADKR